MSDAINIEELKAFLIRANVPHATGTAQTKTEADKSRTIEFAEGDYRMHDNFFGGEPYGGRLVIFHKEQPVFMEVYYGQTTKPADKVYGFLREALQHPGPNNPYRGPAEYTKGELTYKSTVSGDMASHTVKEWIYKNNQEIYWAVVVGGLVDQNAQGAM
ncbi:MAG: hypothetical protein QG553_229 [Patescibacteria group bacterium]|nr:hypothetical protein [Patescibacteria group bacterium]